jgi:hypothetical protein
VELLSTVLRHSELVENPQLKVDILRECLEGWSIVGVLHALVEDQTESTGVLLQEFLQSEMPNDPGERDEYLRRVTRLFTTAIIGFQIDTSLGSEKILESLGVIMRDQQFMGIAAYGLYATMLYADLKGSRWERKLQELVRMHGDHPLVRGWILSFAAYSYFHDDEVTDQERAVLENLIGDLAVKEGRAQEPRGAAGRGAAVVRGMRKSDAMEKIRAVRRDLRRRGLPDRHGGYFERDVR